MESNSERRNTIQITDLTNENMFQSEQYFGQHRLHQVWKATYRIQNRVQRGSHRWELQNTAISPQRTLHFTLPPSVRNHYIFLTEDVFTRS